MIKLATLLFCALSSAEFNLTTGLDQNNRQQILKTLGLGTVTKNTSKPQPLGSNSGLEIGLVTESINTKRISSFIQETENQNSILYPKIVIGKGIYSRSDLFFHFTPFTQTLGLSEYGGLFRYNFFRSASTPLIASLMLHGSSANFNNQLTSRSLGTDILFGIPLGAFSLSSSIGIARATGRFTGGSNGVNASLIDQSEDVKSFHYSVGAFWQHKNLNMGLSLNHFTRPVYSLKIGIIL